VRLRAYLWLGRPSNLPTILSNVLCATALAGLHPTLGTLLRITAGMAALYTGGMFLNDACDATHDAVHRPTRPIPRGWVSVAEAAGGAAALFAVGLLLLASRRGLGITGALCATIVVYDLWHKHNPLAPHLMGGCRALVYLATVQVAGGRATLLLMLGATALFSYVVGLTAWSRSGGRHVGTLVAGISLVDAGALLAVGRPGWAAIALLCFSATRRLQRLVPGT
jgi:4-hydroxybenzoate polyprenyltransferase